MIGQAGAPPVIPAPGFADPTLDAQRVFRAILDALAHPGRPYAVVGPTESPSALGRGLGAAALTLLDEESSVWLTGAPGADPEVAAWLAFHTGVRRADAAQEADFVVTTPAELPDLAGLRLGTDEAPHQSATVLLDVRGCAGPLRLRAEGPGIDGSVDFAAAWADRPFVEALQANNRLFPRGVDLVLIDETSVSALPRTTRVSVVDTSAPDTEDIPADTEKEA